MCSTNVGKGLCCPLSPFTICRSWGDFPIPWIGEFGEVSVFKIMRDACKAMANIARKNSRTFGFRMHWCECLHAIHVLLLPDWLCTKPGLTV